MYKISKKDAISINDMEFIGLEGADAKLPGGNTVKIKIDIEKTLKLFTEKAVKAIEKNKNYLDGFKEIVKNELQNDKKNIMVHLKYIFQLKLNRLDTIVLLEQFIRQPETKIEKISFQTFIDNAIKEVFGNKAEEEISNLLVSSWLREKELTYVNILDEI